MNGKIQYGPARVMTFAPTRKRHVRLADPARFRPAPHTSRAVVLLLGGTAVAAMLVAAIPRAVPGVAWVAVVGGAWLTMVLALTLPSGAELAGAELSRRLGHFRHAINSIGDRPTRADLHALITLAGELGLRDEEIPEELSQVRASLDALSLREQLARGEVPVVGHVEGLPHGDGCHFTCPVRFGRRRSDQFGHLLLTSGWLRFRGALDLSVAWSEVARVQRAGREIIVTLQDSNRALRFGCHTLEESTRGSVVAEYLANAAREDSSGHDEPLYHAAL